LVHFPKYLGVPYVSELMQSDQNANNFILVLTKVK
jgi:hypothetical protein